MSLRRPLSSRVQLGIALLLMAGAGLYCALRLKVTTDITHFLPAGSDHRLATLSRQLADSTLTRTLIVSIGGPTADAVHAAAVAFTDGLRGDPEVAWIQRGPTDKLPEAVYNLYAPRTAYFLSAEPEKEIPAALSDDRLAKSARALKRQLSLPLSPLLARLAGADPLQWFPAILRRFEKAQSGTLEIDGDQFITPEDPDPHAAVRRWAIVFVGTNHSPFDSRAQAPLLAAIDRQFRAQNQRAGGALTLELGGVAPIALDAERHISADLSRISMVSTRRGAAAVLVVLRLAARGAAGVVADCRRRPLRHHRRADAVRPATRHDPGHRVNLDRRRAGLSDPAAHPPGAESGYPARGRAEEIWMGILLGGATTAVGFASLAWTSFPGVREMAVTSSVGIVALLATRYVLPPLCAARRRARACCGAGGALGAGAGLAAAAAGGARGVAVVVLLGCLAGPPAPALARCRSRALDPAHPAARAEPDRVRVRVSRDGRGSLRDGSSRPI